ncbi:MAG: helix-turn-helix domain-containing protein, partial [Desulfocurvibacter africanus]
FREDLYYRLSVIPIRLPPLRERPGDVALLAEHFLKRLCEKHGKTIPGLSPSVMAVLGQYPWPGNVRELRNFMERTVLLSDEGRTVDERDLPMDLLIPRVSLQTEQSAVHDEGLMRAREEFERRYILRCLELCSWNQAAAARLLRIHRNTLLKRMKTLNITAKE